MAIKKRSGLRVYLPIAIGLALLLWFIYPSNLQHAKTPLALFGPSDTPDVVKATQDLFPSISQSLAVDNPLFTAKNKGHILKDFQGDPPHEGTRRGIPVLCINMHFGGKCAVPGQFSHHQLELKANDG